MGRRDLTKAEFAERYDFFVEFLSTVANDDTYPAVQRAAKTLTDAMEREGLVVRVRRPGFPYPRD